MPVIVRRLVSSFGIRIFSSSPLSCFSSRAYPARCSPDIRSFRYTGGPDTDGFSFQISGSSESEPCPNSKFEREK